MLVGLLGEIDGELTRGNDSQGSKRTHVLANLMLHARAVHVGDRFEFDQQHRARFGVVRKPSENVDAFVADGVLRAARVREEHRDVLFALDGCRPEIVKLQHERGLIHHLRMTRAELLINVVTNIKDSGR